MSAPIFFRIEGVPGEGLLDIRVYNLDFDILRGQLTTAQAKEVADALLLSIAEVRGYR